VKMLHKGGTRVSTRDGESFVVDGRCAPMPDTRRAKNAGARRACSHQRSRRGWALGSAMSAPPKQGSLSTGCAGARCTLLGTCPRGHMHSARTWPWVPDALCSNAALGMDKLCSDVASPSHGLVLYCFDPIHSSWPNPWSDLIQDLARPTVPGLLCLVLHKPFGVSCDSSVSRELCAKSTVPDTVTHAG